MKHCIIMVGLPGVGKSTYALNNLPNAVSYPPYYTQSTDNIISNIARVMLMTYDQCFSDLIGFADKYFWNNIRELGAEGENLIIDRTNLTVKSRKKLIDILKPLGYRFEAVIVQCESEELWKTRLNRPGKTIPDHVLKNMIKSYQEPTTQEGFDSIRKIRT